MKQKTPLRKNLKANSVWSLSKTPAPVQAEDWELEKEKVMLPETRIPMDVFMQGSKLMVAVRERL